jgi:cell division protein FtsB
VSSRAQVARGYRLKPAPRARSRRGASRIQWDRVGRIALVLVLALICISYVGPTLNFVDAWRDSKAEHATLDALRAENVKLKQRLTNLEGPDAAERGARKIGMVDESRGEAAYVIRGLNH